MAGSLRRRPDRGRDAWELRVFLGRDARGRVRHRSETFRGSESAAKRKLAQLVTNQDDATSPSVPPLPEWGTQTTINDAIEGWRRNGWEDLSPNTVRGYEGVWRRHVQDSIGKRRIASLSPYDVEQYLRRLKAHGAGKTTVRLVRALLHRSCRLARKWSGNTLPNPITDTELPVWGRKEGPKRVRAPEPDEVLALLKAARFADPRVGALIRLIAATGMRRGEACAIRWDDIDVRDGLVRVDEGVVGVNAPAAARTPKTTASVRMVAVDEVTLDQLANLRLVQEKVALESDVPLRPDGFVFSFEAGCIRPPHPDTMSHAFAEVRDAAGVAADVHLHSLRHFHATAVDPVISEAQKQSRLGWATVQMSRHYTDGVPAEDRRAAEHIGRVLTPNEPAVKPHTRHRSR
jgi:integrase